VQKIHGENPLWDHFHQRGGDVSLLDLVEFWDLENKGSIRDLILKAQDQNPHDDPNSQEFVLNETGCSVEHLIRDSDASSQVSMSASVAEEQRTTVTTTSSSNFWLGISLSGLHMVAFSILGKLTLPRLTRLLLAIFVALFALLWSRYL
jgi:hypothetical protein